MTRTFAAGGLAAAALAGLCAVAATALTTLSGSFAAPGAPGSPGAVRLAVLGAPLPLDPAPGIPTADQLTVVLNGLADPGVPFANKGYLVEGGIGRIEAKTADALMRSAVAKGQVPLNFTVGAITPVAPGAATASVTAAGPAMAPTTQSVTFVDQGGWKLSRASASTVLAIFGS